MPNAQANKTSLTLVRRMVSSLTMSTFLTLGLVSGRCFVAIVFHWLGISCSHVLCIIAHVLIMSMKWLTVVCASTVLFESNRPGFETVLSVVRGALVIRAACPVFCSVS